MEITRKTGGRSSLAEDRLGAPAVLSFVLSAVAPLTVCAGVITTAYAVTGLTTIPAAFIVVALILALFAVGFVAMARRIVNAGAFYSFVARGIGQPAGVSAAFVAVAAYNALQVGLYGAFGASLAEYAELRLHIHVTWWACALGAWLLTAVLGNLAIDLNGKILAILLFCEFVTILVITVSGIVHPAGGRLDAHPLWPGNLLAAGSGAALAIAVLSFTGFEQSAVFSEEVREPRRTVNIATYTSIAVIGVLYGSASWAMTAFYGTGAVVDAAKADGPFAFFRLGGSAVSDVAQVLFITSLFAAMLSFHNAVARYMFALGRERVLPAALGNVNPRTSAPQIASLTQSVLGLIVIVVYAAAGLDPFVQLFFWIGTTGGFGVLLLLCATSAAVIGFAVKTKYPDGVWRSFIAPGLALVALTILAWRTVVDYAVVLGVRPGDRVAWILPSLYLVIALAGLLWGLFLRQARPHVYGSIGLGPAAAGLHRPSRD